MSDVAETVDRLRVQWSLDFRRVRRVLEALHDGATLSQLVDASGLPRRDTEAVLAELAPFLQTDGDRHHLPTGVAAGASAPEEAAVVSRLAELAAGLPPSRWRLDHVPATPETMARRALYLAEEYELCGAAVLCLGDHDLTSLAVGSVEPGADLTVVDIDERILDHIGDSAAGLDLAVTTAWADLRLCLPPSLTGTADLVFTDPPYTTEGMRLFLVRALEALRPTGHGRVAFCFGTGERHLVKALEVQAVLGDLRLALEAMLPGFNRYTGAEAIGSRSDLYICRPTTGAKVGEEARPGSGGDGRRGRGRSRAAGRAVTGGIYTRGPAAEEAVPPSLPDAVRPAAIGAAGDGPHVLVGEGWSEPAVPLPEFFARAAAWATASRRAPFPFAGTPLINTAPDYGAAALRTLLLTAAERVVLILPRRNLDDLAIAVLGAAYEIAAVPAGPGGDPAVLMATRRDDSPADQAEAVLRHVLLHPGAKVVNAWRDGLLAIARDAGRPMTKNEARAEIRAEALSPNLRRLRTWELPVSALQVLGAAIIPR